jgi:hypothetical protein
LTRNLWASCLFGLIYATGAAFAYQRGARVFLFHFAFAAASAWSFFAVSGLLEGRTDPPRLSHRLIKWPAFISAVCLLAALILRTTGADPWFRPVAAPFLAAIAFLCGGFGGYISLLIRRQTKPY